MTGLLIVKCCECGADLGTKPCAPEMDGQVSHGYCARCAAAVRARLGLAPRRAA